MPQKSIPQIEHSFLFLVSGDDFLRRQKIDSLIEQFLSRELKSTNLYRIYADDLDWNQVLAQAKTVSLLSGIQVFWISGAEELKKDWEEFETYCQNPVMESKFIFDCETIPAAHPLSKLVQKNGVHSNFEIPGPETGLKVLQDKVRRAGKSLTPTAWQLLEERLGGSKSLMDQCLDQLVIYSDKSVIDEIEVQALSSELFRFEPFDLTDALLAKNTARALEIFHHFQAVSNDIMGTVGLIHWQLKRIWQAKQMLKKGEDTQMISKTLKIPPFRLNGFLRQVQSFDLLLIERLLQDLWKIDWSSKTGALDQVTAVESFIANAGTFPKGTGS